MKLSQSIFVVFLSFYLSKVHLQVMHHDKSHPLEIVYPLSVPKRREKTIDSGFGDVYRDYARSICMFVPMGYIENTDGIYRIIPNAGNLSSNIKYKFPKAFEPRQNVIINMTLSGLNLSELAFGVATGLLIDKKTVLTAAHAVQNRDLSKYYCIFNFVSYVAGEIIEREQIYTIANANYIYNDDDKDDFAFIKLTREPPNQIPPLDMQQYFTSRFELGTSIFTIGHPLGTASKISFGRLTFGQNNGQYFLSQMDNLQGNSGGPVFNDNNQVIGIVKSFNTQIDVEDFHLGLIDFIQGDDHLIFEQEAKRESRTTIFKASILREFISEDLTMLCQLKLNDIPEDELYIEAQLEYDFLNGRSYSQVVKPFVTSFYEVEINLERQTFIQIDYVKLKVPLLDISADVYCFLKDYQNTVVHVFSDRLELRPSELYGKSSIFRLW